MAHLADFDTKKQYQATVKKTKRLTPEDTEEVREILLEVQQPEFECKVDQSFGVLVNANQFGNTLHHRLYSVADVPSKYKNRTRLTLLVKRCSYVDGFSGELHHGIASNYLCDRNVGDNITITGPFELAFSVPEDKGANLVLIGMGTGIAPFRAFVKHIYKNVKDFHGRILLFYGARSGLELLYLNEKDGDLTNYYNEETFKAFHTFSPRPLWDDPVVIDQMLEERSEEILEMLYQPNTYIYVAGHNKIEEMLEKGFVSILGSKEEWGSQKSKLISEKRWAEIIY